jgi:predicted lipoprotein with Yx(FWY)xxD motif
MNPQRVAGPATDEHALSPVASRRLGGKVRGAIASSGARAEKTLEVLVRRILITAVAVATVAALAAGSASAGSSRSTLKLKKTSVGTILVNGRGFTLYAFTKDRRNHEACQSINGCLSLWPVVNGAGRPILGPGVKRSKVGTITLKSGKKQLTYGGHPLYTYAADSGPGQTFYVNFLQFGGRWPAVNAAGGEVK